MIDHAEITTAKIKHGTTAVTPKLELPFNELNFCVDIFSRMDFFLKTFRVDIFSWIRQNSTKSAKIYPSFNSKVRLRKVSQNTKKKRNTLLFFLNSYILVPNVNN